MHSFLLHSVTSELNLRFITDLYFPHGDGCYVSQLGKDSIGLTVSQVPRHGRTFSVCHVNPKSASQTPRIECT